MESKVEIKLLPDSSGLNVQLFIIEVFEDRYASEITKDPNSEYLRGRALTDREKCEPFATMTKEFYDKLKTAFNKV